MHAGKTSHKYEEEDVSKKHFPASETQEENETKEETEDPVREKNLSDKGIVDADVISTGEIKMAATKKDGTDFSFIQFNSNFNEDFILKLPSQKKIHDLRWFGQQPTQTDFGDIYIEEKFESTERHKQTTEDSDYIYIFVEEVPSISMFQVKMVTLLLQSETRIKKLSSDIQYSTRNIMFLVMSSFQRFSSFLQHSWGQGDQIQDVWRQLYILGHAWDSDHIGEECQSQQGWDLTAVG